MVKSVEVVLPEGWDEKCPCLLCGGKAAEPIITLEGFLCQACAEDAG